MYDFFQPPLSTKVDAHNMMYEAAKKFAIDFKRKNVHEKEWIGNALPRLMKFPQSRG